MMKNTSTFTMVEFLIIVALIALIASILLPTLAHQHHLDDPHVYQIGDAAYINVLSLTGVVNYVSFDYTHVNMFVKNKEGQPMELDNVATNLLTPLPLKHEWMP